MRWSGFLAFSAVIGAHAAEVVPPDAAEAAYPAIERFVEVLDAVRTRHPDVDRVSYDRLVNHALEGMLASLDPHSSFIHPEMAAYLERGERPDPEVRSLGLTLAIRTGGPYVHVVEPGGPAERAGVAAGDSVVSVNGRPAEELALEDLLGAMAGSPGEKKILELLGPGEPRPREVTMVHRVVEERSVAEARMLGDGVTGYIRLAQFGPRSAREMEAALDDLEDGGASRMILDLRGNGGGDLHETVRILGFFVPPGTEVVTTRGRDADKHESLKTPDRQRRERGYPLVVLIDKGSASASELTAGALQDLKRAAVVGERSYGKGSVQNIVPMGGGTALRLTVATYHTPSGRTPHRVGVEPDVEVAVSDDDRERVEKLWRKWTLVPAERAALEAWDDPVMTAAQRAFGK